MATWVAKEYRSSVLASHRRGRRHKFYKILQIRFFGKHSLNKKFLLEFTGNTNRLIITAQGNLLQISLMNCPMYFLKNF